jgi:hypothetical protein
MIASSVEIKIDVKEKTKSPSKQLFQRVFMVELDVCE